MASLKRRHDGKWRARYRDHSGVEHAKHFGRKVDGQRWLDEQTTALVTGQYVDPRAGRVKFEDFAESVRAVLAHSPATRDLMERCLRRHVYPALGDQPIRVIRASTVQALVTDLGTRLAPSTVRLVFGYVAAIFRAAVRDKVIVNSPCEAVRLPERRKPHMVIPPLSVLDVLAASLPPRFRVVPDLVVGCGLRQGELFGLESDSVEFLRGRSVTVRQQLVTLAPEPPYLGKVKTPESERVVPLAQVTLDGLAAHLHEHPARGVEVQDRTDPNNPLVRTARLLFTTDDGSPVTRHRWSEVWQPAARAAGLPRRTGLHALRHMYASLLIRHGESAKTVQKRLGHGSAGVTLDTYSHLWPDADDRTREAVEEALGGRSADPVRTAGVLS